MIPTLLAALVVAGAEHATAWSEPVRGLRARLVEVDEPGGAYLAIELENVGRSSVTFVWEAPRAMQTPTWGAQLSAAWTGDGRSWFAGGAGPVCVHCSHELSPGKRERLRIGVQWDVLRRAGPRAPGPLRFQALFSADAPEDDWRSRVAQQWTGRIDTPELVARFIHEPVEDAARSR